MRWRRENNKIVEEEGNQDWGVKIIKLLKKEDKKRMTRRWGKSNQWTGIRTITAAGNRAWIITLRLTDFKSQTSFTLLLRHYELTNENVYFLTNQSKTKTFIDLKITRKPKPTKNSTRPYLNEIPAHFTHEIKTKGYDVIGINSIPLQVNEIPAQKSGESFHRILFIR